ncbi:MAG: hypothetical protein ACI80V_001047 [Rhodothermales bacterium]
MHRKLTFLPILLALFVGGCLPYSCNRTESRRLSPEDSLSRAFAGGLPVDTLQALGPVSIPELEYPRTVAFGPDGTLWVSDTGSQKLFAVRDTLIAVVAMDSLLYPYIVGFRENLPVVFSPDASRIEAVGGSWAVQTPAGLPPRILQYAAVSDSSVWMKFAGEDFASHLVRLADDGQELERIPLDDPYWRWAGALRLRNGVPVSLSGYRPVLYSPGFGGAMGSVIDSTVLFGFDSPMLPRTRTFLTGDISQPPLLSPSGVFVGDEFFAINIRPGWLQIDIYDSAYRLRRILVESDPSFGQEFFPADIAVMRDPDGHLTIAAAITAPVPQVRLFRVGEARSPRP